MMRYQPHMFRRQQGVTVLAIVIAIAALIGIVALAIGTGTFLGLQSIERQGTGAIVLAAAESGARDALLRIARDRDFECSGTVNCPSNADCTVESGTDGYSLTVGSITTCVKVSRFTATCPGPGHQAAILSFAKSGTIEQRIQVLVSVDCDGKINLQSWKELTS